MTDENACSDEDMVSNYHSFVKEFIDNSKNMDEETANFIDLNYLALLETGTKIVKIKGEDELIFKSILDSLKIKYLREYKFHPTRRFRFDFAIIDRKIAFEIDGGIYTSGRHTSPIGYCNDCIKQILAGQLGWRIFKIPTPWLHHHHYHKPKKHLMTYRDLVELVKDLTL